MMIAEHMAAARHFIKEGKFARARQEITMAAEHLSNPTREKARRAREIAALERDVAARLADMKEHW